MIITFTSFAQSDYAPGYVIFNDGSKQDCLIKDSEWKYNPASFKYKPDERYNPITGNLDNVQEFGIPGKFKYQRASIDLDVSSDEIEALSYSKLPEYKYSTVFLKVNIEGKATLYSYRTGKYLRFFFNSDNGEIQPLVYKKYKVTNSTLGENIQFRQQLLNTLQCESLKKSTLENVTYAERSLEKVFQKYNACNGVTYTDYSESRKSGEFHLSVLANANLTGLKVNRGFQTQNTTTELDNTITPSLGVELEYAVPFNNYRWAINFRPSLNFYKGKRTMEESQNLYGDLNAEFTYIEWVIALKYYFMRKEKFQLYAMAGGSMDSYLKADVSYYSGPEPNPNPWFSKENLEIISSLNFAVGFNYRDFLFSIMIRPKKAINGNNEIPRDFLLNWEGEKTMTTFSVGYRFF
ncbi:hypothetical protein DMZ48_02930 [Robertkochia solimangrovi]|nr:hypothetical protein DMZ48_02930 [Robertkochia solimangrovi]